VAAGLTVVTTAGVQNHDLVKSLGAKHVFDYKSQTVIEDILKVLKKGDLVMDCISVPTTQVICTEIVHTLGGGKLPALRWPEASKYDDVEIIFGMFRSVQKVCYLLLI
jgi:D-arabinose 1-dehydrogenase-like Zn-dependent alcohol dehydrogenase